jgi:hypothetical protein
MYLMKLVCLHLNRSESFIQGRDTSIQFQVSNWDCIRTAHIVNLAS